jgi:transcriptional regulator with XRE-family HTH domain
MKRDRAQRLRTLRADQEPKVTQAQLAHRAGIGEKRYWQIENGEGADPSPDEMKAVAAALNVKVGDIAWPDALKAKAS